MKNTVRTCNDGNIVPVSILRCSEKFLRFVASELQHSLLNPNPYPFERKCLSTIHFHTEVFAGVPTSQRAG